MANPVVTPPPPPVRRPRSSAGPIVLIVLGVIFLFGNLHMISWERLGTLYAHYWGALLILWGVIKVIEYQRAQREGLQPRGIGASGVVLAIAIIVSGLVATQVTRVNWSGLRNQINIDDDDFNDIFGDKYSFDDHLNQDFPAHASLKVLDDRGAVSVHASDDNKISVVVRKRVGADDQNQADKYNEETKPTITAIGGLVTLDARTNAAGDHPIETDLDISIPRKASVTIVSRRGDVAVSGREGDIDISNQHSDVSVEDVKGNVRLNLERSSAKLEEITGDVQIRGRLNEVSVLDVKGGAQLDGDFMESVKLGRVDKTVTFKSSRTDMDFSKIQGELDLNSDDLHADNLEGPVHLTTRSKEIRLDAVSGDVRLKDENGGVEITMRSLGNVQIENRNGDIQLSVPEKPGFHVDARTHDGEIQSDFSELRVENGESQSSASGTVGNATSHIVLSNEHGGIEISKAAASSAPVGGVSGGITGGIPAPKQPKSGKSLPQPKQQVEPTDN